MDQIRATPTSLGLARRVLQIEAEAVRQLATRIDGSFLAALDLILSCSGRLVVCGIGKSGHVSRKIAATFASTGTPAYFLHAAEASHGDLGVITREDVVLALSNSGESPEVLTIVPLVKRRGARLIAMTGNPDSTLAKEADAHLDASVSEEACPLNLAPTASTTAALALGDALAVAALDARGFSASDFAQSHPGGTLGRRLLTHVADVMHTGTELPQVPAGATLAEAIAEMTRGRLGMTAIVDDTRRVIGIFTDGDLRRTFERSANLSGLRVADAMTKDPRTLHPKQLAAEAAEMMERLRINQLLVVDDDGRLVGALNTHDLLRAKVI